MPAMATRWGYAIATCCGIGRAKFAGGTLASLAAVPVHVALSSFAGSAEVLVVILLVVVGTWSAQIVCDASGAADPQIVVVDEFAGSLIAMWLAGSAALLAVVAAVALFRLFDIAKPWPIRYAERLEPAGVATMADDVAASIAAGAIVYFARSLT